MLKRTKLTLHIFLLSGLLALSPILSGQEKHDYQWWADAHNWDGVTHWSRYIKRLPGYMGPNALPIPELGNAKTAQRTSLKVAAEYHKSHREMAVNPYLNLDMVVVKDKVALNFIYRPFEYYETDAYIRHERYGRNKDRKGYAKSDLYIGTLIQILDAEKHPLDAQLRIMLKTTSGKDFANGRHTDAPAYLFDLNFGKQLFQSDNFISEISLYSMAGLFVWQMEFDNNRQNDAYLYGLRTDVQLQHFRCSFTFSGYSGYMNMRDKPMAMRYSISTQRHNKTIELSYQQGLRDIIKHSLRLGMAYHFN